MLVTSSCSHQDITKDFIEYNLNDDEIYKLYRDTFPFTFSVKYPQEWDTGWSSDFGIAFFL